MLWCTQADIQNRYPAFDLTQAPFSVSVVGAAIADASALIESRLASRYAIPSSLASIPADLTMHACRIAFYRLLVARGMQAPTGDDDVYYREWTESVEYMTQLQQEKVHPQLTLLVDAGIPRMSSGRVGTALTEGGAVGAYGHPQRGW